MRSDRPAILLTWINTAFAIHMLNPRATQQRDANNPSMLATTRAGTSWTYSLITSTIPVNASSTSTPPIIAFSPHIQPNASSIIGPAPGPDRRNSSRSSSSAIAPYGSPNVLMSVSSEVGPAWGPSPTTSGEGSSTGSSGAQRPGLNVVPTATGIGSSNGGDGGQATVLPDSLQPQSGSTYTGAQATTDSDGKASTAKYTAYLVAVPSGQVTQGDSNVPAQTVLCQATIITTFISLAAPTSSADQRAAVAGQTFQTDPSLSGTCIVGAGTTLAAGEPAVTTSGAYSVTVNGHSQMQFVNSTTAGASITVIRSSGTASSNRTGTAVTPEVASSANVVEVWWKALALAMICLGIVLR